MKMPSIGALSLAVVGVAALALIAVGAPGDRRRPTSANAPATGPNQPSVSAKGFTLTSTSVVLPGDDQLYPDGPHADVVNANCASCHSASMALTQPRLSREQWKATVAKMREVYKAPVADRDVAAIVDYLSAMPGQQ